MGVKLSRYWDLSATLLHAPHAPPSPRLDSAVTTTRALLEESVKLHLLSDVPLGVFLSGGIDSSALVALASQCRDTPLTTLSIVFDESEYSEAPYARLMAQRYQTDHHEVLLRSADFFAQLPRLFAAMDQPTVDGVNTYCVSQAAKQAGLTVVLSGIGGDEVFLGYGHLKKVHPFNGARDLFATLPLWVRKSFLHLTRQAAALTGRNSVEKFAYLAEPSNENVYLFFRGLFAPRQIQDLLGISERELTALGLPVSSRNDGKPYSLSDASHLFEFHYYLQSQLLKDADFMSMAHTLETRVPYLDHRLVEYVVGLPVALKRTPGLNKPLLLKALGENLPEAIWGRRKMGFTFPLAPWLQHGAEELQSYSLNPQGLQKTAVAKVWQEFREGRMHWLRPWALAVLGALA